MLNQLNINQYMYNVYDEYQERYFKNALEYSNNNGLIIRYFKIEVDESYNFDSETSIQTDYKKFKYSIYDFVPIIDAQPPVSQSYYDPTIQGTSYNVTMTITIGGIKKPLPGDLFHYYDITGKGEIDKNEIFRVRNVNYIRSSHEKFPMYQLDVEYAPMKRSTLDEIAAKNVIHHYYWDNESNTFLTDKQYKYYHYLNLKRADYLKDISNLYDETKAKYINCKINSVFKIIQKKNIFPVKIISPDEEFLDYDLKDFMGYFTLYYKLKNINPVTGEKFDEELDKILSDEVSKLNSDLDNSEDKTIIYKDFNCDNLINFIQDPTKIKYEEIFKITKKIDSNDSDDSDVTYIFEHGNYFNYYDKLYKLLFCYYSFIPNFWNNSVLAHQLNTEVTYDDGIFYNINGKYVDYFEYLKEIKYDPGYALSYQGGAQYFTPGNTLAW